MDSILETVISTCHVEVKAMVRGSPHQINVATAGDSVPLHWGKKSCLGVLEKLRTLCLQVQLGVLRQGCQRDPRPQGTTQML